MCGAGLPGVSASSDGMSARGIATSPTWNWQEGPASIRCSAGVRQVFGKRLARL